MARPRTRGHGDPGPGSVPSHAERCLLEAGIGVVVDIILPRVVRLCLTLNEPYM